jgi:hypothetical protein
VKRRVRAQFIIFSLMIVVLSMALPLAVRAVDYNVGVKVGDWIKYGQIKVTWTGNGTEPSYVTGLQKIDWVRTDVENINGTNVTLIWTVHFNNGTQTPENLSVDVAGTEETSGFTLLIASNLKRGDAVVNGTNSPTINQTTTGIYAGANRNVNLLEFTSVYDNQTMTNKIYWDQSTGVMVEEDQKSPDYSSPGAFIGISIKATETNMWSLDFIGTLYNNLVYIIAGVVIAIFVIAAALFLRRKKTPPPPPPLTQQQQTENKNESQSNS